MKELLEGDSMPDAGNDGPAGAAPRAREDRPAEALLREAQEYLRLSRNHSVHPNDCDTCDLMNRIDAHLTETE